MKNVFYPIVCLLFMHIAVVAQPLDPVTAKFSQDQQSRFAKALKMLQQSSLYTRVAAGESLTILFPPDFSLDGLSAEDADSLFIKKNTPSIENYLSRYSVEGFWDLSSINARLSNASPALSLVNKKGEKLDFSRNGDFLMATSANGYESNIESSIKVNNTTIFLLTGLLK